MKRYKPRKEAVLIYESMEHRLKELWNKLISGNCNGATQFAYEIGFIADIESSLKEQKLIK